MLCYMASSVPLYIHQVSFNVTVDTSISPLPNGTHPPYSYPQYNVTNPVITKLLWLQIYHGYFIKRFLDMVSMIIQNADRSINFWVSER